MKDLMIDLETLGTKPNSPIIAIGAVFFDRKTGELGASFESVVEFDSACEDRAIDPSTVAWWMGQSDAARKGVLRGENKMARALADFVYFVKDNSEGTVHPWGNGSTFDISMLENCLEQFGYETPWPFWAIRDCRTVECISGIDKRHFKREGVHHWALDDAKHQVKYISAMIRGIEGES